MLRSPYKRRSALRHALMRLALLPWVSAGLLLVVLVAADTDAGRDLLARALTAAGGGRVATHGISGELPFRPRIERLELIDGEGAWLRAEGIALVLRPAALLRGALEVRALTVDRLELIRLPGAGTGSGARFQLPVAVRLQRLVIARLLPTALGPSAPALAVTGSAEAARAAASADLRLTVPGRPDRYRLSLATEEQGQRLAVAVRERADGPLSALARTAGVPLPPGLVDWTLDAEARGPLEALAVEAEITVGAHRASLRGVIDLPARRIGALDAGLRLASMRVALPGRRDVLAWDRISANAELSGPLLAPQGALRMAADGLLWHRAADRVDAAGAPDPGRREADGRTGVPARQARDLFAGALELDGHIDLARGPALNATLNARPTRIPDPWGRLLGPAPRLSLSVARDGPRWTIRDGQLDTALLGLGLAGQIGGRAPDPAWALDLHLGESRVAGVDLSGALRFAADARLPTGAVGLRIARLDEAVPALLPLLPGGAPPNPAAGWWRGAAGRLEARLTLAGADGMRLIAGGAGLRLPFGVSLGTLALEGELREPLGPAMSTARLRIGDLTAASTTGDLELRAEGPLHALALDASARLGPVGAGDVRIAGAGRFATAARRLTLASLTADTRGRRLALLAPASIDFTAGVVLQSVQLGLSPAPAAERAGAGADVDGTLELTGRIAPRLGVDARVADLDLAALSPWLPWLPAGLDGVLDGDASLAGRAQAPTGRVRLEARGLALAAVTRVGLPPAAGRLTVTLEQAAAQLAAEAWVGEQARLAVDGRVRGRPWSPTAPLALRGRGQMDLALLGPWLGAGGRRAEGRVGLDVGIAGTRAAPQLDGRLAIDDGAWRDGQLGLWLDDIDGRARLDGDRLRIERLAAGAGAGTITLDGDVGWLSPAQPVDLRLRARGAEPLQLDRLRFKADADLSLRGALAGDASLAGDLRFERVEIHVPERLPADIPTLDVVELGERRQPRRSRRAAAAGAWRERLGLDVRVDASQAIQVRGRNLEAVLGGRVHLRGTAAAPAAEGGFALRRGAYELLGRTLRFERGRIRFDGGDLLDPTLDLEARAQSPGGTAILAVEGRAQAPRLVLRGEPPMTEDEVLSRLLFGVPPGRLSAVQLTRLGLAAASFAGVGGDGAGLLERARTGLGLGTLRIGSDRHGDTVVEGGRNLTERVYLGARQGTEGGEPRAVLRLELTPQIRLESDVGGGGLGAGAAFELDY